MNPILGRYCAGVSLCQQTSDNNLGWSDPHPPPELRRWLYRSSPRPLRTDPATNADDNQGHTLVAPCLGRSEVRAAS